MFKGIFQLFKRIGFYILGWNEVRENSKPYDNLNLLIERAEMRMKIRPFCPFCGTKMMFRQSRIVNLTPIRDDIGYKCPKCFHTSHFGIPITLAEYEEEYKIRKGVFLLTPTYRQDECFRKDVLKRLKELGYIEAKK